jgi:5S rRNA maturation endonuclease (ribonuclease M5)
LGRKNFLLEAKWVTPKIPASSIYAFKGKLDGKFHTTSGIYMAVNGYSDDVEDALKFGKSLNILLFDSSDIKLIFNGEVTFLDVLKFKLREAGDTGSLNAPYSLKTKAETISRADKLDFLTTELFQQKHKKRKITEDLLIFVEGKTDIQIVDNLLKPIKLDFLLSYKIIPLEGVNNIRQIPSLLNQYATYHQTKAVIVILDDDQATLQIKGIIENVIEQIENSSIPINTKFFYIDEKLKHQLSNEILENVIFARNYKKPLLYMELERFMNEISYEYYNPEVDIPRESLKSTLQKGEWDFENSEISFPDDYTSRNFTIKNLDDLIEYLNEEMIRAVQGEMPLYLLKENDYLDYETEVREYLSEYYKDKLKKLNWDTDEL